MRTFKPRCHGYRRPPVTHSLTHPCIVLQFYSHRSWLCMLKFRHSLHLIHACIDLPHYNIIIIIIIRRTILWQSKCQWQKYQIKLDLKYMKHNFWLKVSKSCQLSFKMQVVPTQTVKFKSCQLKLSSHTISKFHWKCKGVHASTLSFKVQRLCKLKLSKVQRSCQLNVSKCKGHANSTFQKCKRCANSKFQKCKGLLLAIIVLSKIN